MPKLVATTTIQERVLTQDEFWQAKGENVLATADRGGVEGVQPGDGIELTRLVGFTFLNGSTVSYQSKTGEVDIWVEPR